MNKIGCEALFICFQGLAYFRLQKQMTSATGIGRFGRSIFGVILLLLGTSPTFLLENFVSTVLNRA
jgi:hypothetical protein